MSRRWPLLTALVAAAFLFFYPSTGQGMLADSDTAVLLRAIRERNAPWSWFLGDWPLFNHFYRPIPTVIFEMDSRLYGDVGAGYARTNAILAGLAVLALYWLVRELTDRRWTAAACAAIFALWSLDKGWVVSTGLGYLVTGALIFGTVASILRGEWPKAAVVAWLVGTFVVGEASGVMTLKYRTLDWLPGRTAMVMTVFALVAMAAYARYERLSAVRLPRPAPGPLDPPATRSASANEPLRPAIGWALLSVVAVLGAFASYEQAVMLPACLLGVAVAQRVLGRRPRWGWQIAFWGCLVGYAILRRAIIPSGASGYQLQQFRSGPGVWLSVLDYFLPPLPGLVSIAGWLESGWLVFLTGAPYRYVVTWLAVGTTVLKARTVWLWPFVGWFLSSLAFLPMGWLKQFDHYHQWPMALRALLVVALIPVWARLAVSGCSRRPRPAPPRSSPAPGSLPHP